MIKLVFFDFDGVLTLESHACVEICRYLETVAKIPAKKIEPVFHQIAKQLLTDGKKFGDYIDSINDQLDSNLTVDDILNTYKKSQLNYEIVDVLHELKKNKIRTGIITDNNKDRMEIIRKHPEFSSMSPIVGSCDIGCTKDMCEDIFKEALKQADIKAEECIFIDDKPQCLEIPEKLGFKTYLHNSIQNNVEDLRNYLKNYNLL